MTNAVKAAIIAAVNATLGLLIAFDVALSALQQGATLTFVNALLGLWVAVTYKNSNKRLPDG